MTSDPAYYRFEQFKKLNFTDQQAARLAESKDSKGVYLYAGDVKRMLDRASDRYSGDVVKARDIVFDILSDDAA